MERKKLAPDALLGLEEAAAWAGCSLEVLSQAVSSGALLHETRRVRGREVPHVRFVDLEALVQAPVEAPLDPLDEPLAVEEPGRSPSEPGTATQGEGPEQAAPLPSPTAALPEPGHAPTQPPPAAGEDARGSGGHGAAAREHGAAAREDSAPARGLELRVEELLMRLEASEQERRAQAAALLLTNRRLLELAGPASGSGSGRRGGLALGSALLVAMAAFAWWGERTEARWEQRLSGAEALGEERLAVVATKLSQQRARLDEEAQARAAAAEAASLREERLREELAAAAEEGLEQARAVREEAALQLIGLLDRQEQEREAWARQAEAREAARERTLQQLLADQQVERRRQDERAQAELASVQTAMEEKLAAVVEQTQRERVLLEGSVEDLLRREAQQSAEVERLRGSLRASEARLGELAARGDSLQEHLEAAERESARPESSAELLPEGIPWGVWLAERLGRALAGPRRRMPPDQSDPPPL
ncbi:MAG: hypothetical protein ISQ08_02380 [Planctomycetes bacterium]|nr:hypothetical protein [Planctomycetota bacterium]